MLKKENGVTLVALVITIIVLLILAGVTLMMVMGESGVFAKARKASADTNVANAREAVQRATSEVTVSLIDDNGNYTTIYKKDSTTNIDIKDNAAKAVEAINAELTKAGEGYSLVQDTGNIYKIQKGSEDVKDYNDAEVKVEITLSDTNAIKVVNQ